MLKSELKQKLTKLIANLDDDELLHDIYQMLNHDLSPFKLKEEDRFRITKARQEIKQRLFSTHEEVKKRTSQWLKT